MNNLKKTVALVIAVAMVLSMGAISAFAAYPDVANDASYAEAVNILSNLNVLKGDDQGNFNPDKTITRAEVATVIVRILGMESAAQSSMGSTPFTDVPADHWASGFINVAYQQGAILGMGDGTFAPEDEVTYEQVIKMIVAAMGYTLKANDLGGYPTGYLSVASTEGITKGANGSVGSPAKRSTVARLVYNALEVGFMEVSSWTSTGANEYTVNKDVTFLSKLDVEKAEVIVTESYLSGSEYDADDRTVTLGYAKSTRATNTTDATDKYADFEGANGDFDGTFEVGNTDAANFLGYSAVAYVGIDDDTDKDTVFAIAEKSGRNVVTRALTDKGLVDDDEDLSGSDSINDFGDVYYWASSSDRKYSTATLADDVYYVVNGEIDNSIGQNRISNDFLLSEIAGGGSVVLLDNDNNDEFDFVFVTKYDQETVVDEIDVDDELYTFTGKSGLDSIEIDLADDDMLYNIIKNGRAIEASDIAVGDTLTISKSANDAIQTIRVSDTQVTGRVSAYDSEDETWTINGVDYEATAGYQSTGDGLEANSNFEGTIYLNADGLIVFAEGESTKSGTYGFITGASKDTKFSTTYTLQIVTANGTTEEYDLNTKVSVNGKSGASAETVFNILTNNGGDIVLKYPVIRYTLSGSKINRLYTTYSDANDISALKAISNLDSAMEDISLSRSGKENTRTYDAEELVYGSSIEFDSKTVLFSIPENGVVTDDDDVTVSTVVSTFEDGESYYFASFDGSDDLPGVVIGYGIETSIDDEAYAIVLTSVKSTTIDDNDAYLIEGIQDGKKVSLTLYNGEDDVKVIDNQKHYQELGSAADLKVGDVIATNTVVDGYADSVALIAAKADIVELEGVVDYFAESKSTGKEDDAYVAIGAITEKGSNKSLIMTGEDNTFLATKAGTKITLVDMSSSKTRPEIKNSSFSAVNRTPEQNFQIAVVKQFDGDILDIIVYRFKSIDDLTASTTEDPSKDSTASSTEGSSEPSSEASTPEATPEQTPEDEGEVTDIEDIAEVEEEEEIEQL